MYCTDPENIPTHPMECQWKFQEGGGSPKPTFLKESIGLNWNFQGGGFSHQKNPSMRGYGYFLEQHIGQWVIPHTPLFFLFCC